MTNLKNNEEAHVKFKKKGWTDKNKCKVEGKILTAKGEQALLIHGKWNDKLYMKNLKTGADECIW